MKNTQYLNKIEVKIRIDDAGLYNIFLAIES